MDKSKVAHFLWPMVKNQMVAAFTIVCCQTWFSLFFCDLQLEFM